jgi:hypothetical protein
MTQRLAAWTRFDAELDATFRRHRVRWLRAGPSEPAYRFLLRALPQLDLVG